MSFIPDPENKRPLTNYESEQLLYYLIAVLHQRPHWIPTIREYIENNLSKSTGKEQSMIETHPVSPPIPHPEESLVTESPPNNIWEYLEKRFPSRESK